ncbi:hypothetical protein TNCV_1884591 [Trichonephila clavipes]|nr:hypothetical protein TNCV_1884591 [Trichonephila clavipes]
MEDTENAKVSFSGLHKSPKALVSSGIVRETSKLESSSMQLKDHLCNCMPAPLTRDISSSLSCFVEEILKHPLIRLAMKISALTAEATNGYLCPSSVTNCLSTRCEEREHMYRTLLYSFGTF